MIVLFCYQMLQAGWMDDDPKEKSKGIDGDEVTLSCIVDPREDGEVRKRKEKKEREERKESV